jgi:hypothetical protein
MATFSRSLVTHVLVFRAKFWNQNVVSNNLLQALVRHACAVVGQFYLAHGGHFVCVPRYHPMETTENTAIPTQCPSMKISRAVPAQSEDRMGIVSETRGNHSAVPRITNEQRSGDVINEQGLSEWARQAAISPDEMIRCR